MVVDSFLMDEGALFGRTEEWSARLLAFATEKCQNQAHIQSKTKLVIFSFPDKRFHFLESVLKYVEIP